MKSSSIIKYFAMLLAGLVIFQSCSDDSDDGGNEPAAEFVATSASFANFRDWTEVAQHQGPGVAIGGAHHGPDEEVSRTIYVKNNQKRGSDGEFPVGTLIVKDTRKNGETIEVTAMVKRGNGFNPDHNDWEWFMLAADGKIAKDNNSMELRGAQLLGGMCGNCHAQASNKDFSFLD